MGLFSKIVKGAATVLGGVLGGPAGAEAAATVTGSLISGHSARAAASEQADAILKAGERSAAAAAQARADALELYGTGLSDYARSVQSSIDELTSGRTNAGDLLTRSAANTDWLVQRGSESAQRALLGLPAPGPQSYGVPANQGYDGWSMASEVANGAAPTQRDISIGEAGGQPTGEAIDPYAAYQQAYEEAMANPPEYAQDQTHLAMNANDMGVNAMVAAQEQNRQAGFDSGVATRSPQSEYTRVYETARSQGADRTTANEMARRYTSAMQSNAGTDVGSAIDPMFPARGQSGVPGFTLGGVSTPQDYTGTGWTGVGVAREDMLRAERGAMGSADRGYNRLSDAESRVLGVLGFDDGKGGYSASGTGYGGGGGGYGGYGQSMVDSSGVDHALASGLATLSSAEQRALAEQRRGTEGAVGELAQYADTGEQALQREAALAGALGPEAQAQAIAEFQESPGQKYFRERQEKALLRNSAAIGGLGGGNVRTALQEQAVGIAAQQQQQQLENLRSLAAQGYGAASQQGTFRQEGGNLGAGIIASLANTAAGLHGQRMGIAGQLASQGASASYAAAAQNRELAYRRQALAANTIAQLAGQSLGLTGSEMTLQYNTGQGLAGLAERGGTNLAGVISGAAGAQGGIQSTLGTNLANLETGYGTDVANLLTQAGIGQLGARESLSATLGNISSGQGTDQANLAIAGGQATSAGTLGQASAWNQGLQGLASIAGQYMSPSTGHQAPLIAQSEMPTQSSFTPNWNWNAGR